MKKVLLFAATVALLFATSCKKDANAPENIQLGENEFLVSIDNGAVPQNAPAIHDGMNTMTTIDGNRCVFWEKGKDVITINGQPYTATESGTTVIFTGEGAGDGPDYYAFYGVVGAGSSASASLPANQTYTALNNVSNLPMYAEGGSDKRLTFHNICAVLKITVPEFAAGAHCIVVSSDQVMNGSFHIGDNFTAVMDGSVDASGTKNKITMKPQDNGTFIEDDVVYIAVPAQEYTNLRIEFLADDYDNNSEFNDNNTLWHKTIDKCTLRVNHVIDVNMTALKCLCFEAVEGSSSVTFNEIPDLTDLEGDPVSIQYLTESADGTIGVWTDYESDSEISLEYEGDKVYFRASANHEVSFGDYDAKFSIEGQVKVSGNIMSLYGPNCPDNFELPSNAFWQLFYECDGLTEAQELELPARKLGHSCYADMFSGCTSLTKAPKLPAKQLVNDCYQAMFQLCYLLEEVYIYATGGFDKLNCLDGWLNNDAGTEATNPIVHCKSSVVTNIEATVDTEIWSVEGDL